VFRPSLSCLAVGLSLAVACGGSTTATDNSSTGTPGNTGSNGGNSNANVPASVEITPAGPLTFDVLQATQLLTATVKNSSGATITASVTWVSDAPTVASIPSSGGAVTAVANGTAHITAKTDNGITSAPLTVVVQQKTTISPLVKIAGDAQQAVVNTSLVTPITVRANDANGNPLAGVSVSFKASAGTFSAPTVLTGANGQASSVWNMPIVAGPLTATVSLVSNPSATVSFSALAVTAPPQQLVKLSGDSQRGSVSAQLADPLVMVVTDQYNNGISGIPMTLAVAAGGGSISASNVVTDANGRVSVTWTLGANEAQSQAVSVTTGVSLTGSPTLFSATAVRATVGTLGPTPFRAGCHVSTTVTGIGIGDTPFVTMTFDGVPATVTLTSPTNNGVTLTAIAPSLNRASGTAATVVLKIFSQTFTQTLVYDPIANCT
jgi:adhesin/invasin